MPERFLYYSEVLLRLLPEQDYARPSRGARRGPAARGRGDRCAGRVIVWNAALAAVAGPRESALGAAAARGGALAARGPQRRLGGDPAGRSWRGGGPGPSRGTPLGHRVVRATLGPMRGAGGACWAPSCASRTSRAARARRSGGACACGRRRVRLGRRDRARDPQPPERALPEPAAPARAARGPHAHRATTCVRKADAMIAEVGAHGVAHPEPARGESRGRARCDGTSAIDDIVARTCWSRSEEPRRARGCHAPRCARTPAIAAAGSHAHRARPSTNIVRNAIDAAGEAATSGSRRATTRTARWSSSTTTVPASDPTTVDGVRALLDEQARRYGTRSAAGSRAPSRATAASSRCSTDPAAARASCPPADPRGPGRAGSAGR